MQYWKFLLYGITGDLSKKKILPALAQFAELNQEKVQIELIGYSRSMPDSNQIQNILNTHTSTGITVIEKITYLQGEYADSKIFFDFIGGLEENQRLVTYLAIPPELFLDILKNSCPFSSREIDIIIEKPFGRSLEEAHQMLKIMDACDLHKKIHFSDHYLFKTSTFISKQEWSNFKDIKTKPIKKINLSALENIGVKDRGGYYDNNGALKDIFVHLFSLLDLSLKQLTESEENDFSSFKVKSLELGQYNAYLKDLNLDKSTTDTYFKLLSEIQVTGQPVEVSFESGKKLRQKTTAIELEYIDGSSLKWKIAPENQLEYTVTDSSTSINLAKNNKLDHTNLLELLLIRDTSRFVDSREIITGWEIYNKIVDFKQSQNITPKIYEDGTQPPSFLN